jgi:hypothetical protein
MVKWIFVAKIQKGIYFCVIFLGIKQLLKSLSDTTFAGLSVFLKGRSGAGFTPRSWCYP